MNMSDMDVKVVDMDVKVVDIVNDIKINVKALDESETIEIDFINELITQISKSPILADTNKSLVPVDTNKSPVLADINIEEIKKLEKQYSQEIKYVNKEILLTIQDSTLEQTLKNISEAKELIQDSYTRLKNLREKMDKLLEFNIHSNELQCARRNCKMAIEYIKYLSQARNLCSQLEFEFCISDITVGIISDVSVDRVSDISADGNDDKEIKVISGAKNNDGIKMGNFIGDKNIDRCMDDKMAGKIMDADIDSKVTGKIMDTNTRVMNKIMNKNWSEIYYTIYIIHSLIDKLNLYSDTRVVGNLIIRFNNIISRISDLIVDFLCDNCAFIFDECISVSDCISTSINNLSFNSSAHLIDSNSGVGHVGNKKVDKHVRDIKSIKDINIKAQCNIINIIEKNKRKIIIDKIARVIYSSLLKTNQDYKCQTMLITKFINYLYDISPPIALQVCVLLCHDVYQEFKDQRINTLKDNEINKFRDREVNKFRDNEVNKFRDREVKEQGSNSSSGRNKMLGLEQILDFEKFIRRTFLLPDELKELNSVINFNNIKSILYDEFVKVQKNKFQILLNKLINDDLDFYASLNDIRSDLVPSANNNLPLPSANKYLLAIKYFMVKIEQPCFMEFDGRINVLCHLWEKYTSYLDNLILNIDKSDSGSDKKKSDKITRENYNHKINKCSSLLNSVDFITQKYNEFRKHLVSSSIISLSNKSPTSQSSSSMSEYRLASIRDNEELKLKSVAMKDNGEVKSKSMFMKDNEKDNGEVKSISTRDNVDIKSKSMDKKLYGEVKSVMVDGQQVKSTSIEDNLILNIEDRLRLTNIEDNLRIMINRLVNLISNLIHSSLISIIPSIISIDEWILKFVDEYNTIKINLSTERYIMLINCKLVNLFLESIRVYVLEKVVPKLNNNRNKILKIFNINHGYRDYSRNKNSSNSYNDSESKGDKNHDILLRLIVNIKSLGTFLLSDDNIILTLLTCSRIYKNVIKQRIDIVVNTIQLCATHDKEKILQQFNILFPNGPKEYLHQILNALEMKS